MHSFYKPYTQLDTIFIHYILLVIVMTWVKVIYLIHTLRAHIPYVLRIKGVYTYNSQTTNTHLLKPNRCIKGPAELIISRIINMTIKARS